MNARPNFIRPLIAAGTHPVETGRYVIATPTICALHDAVKKWIINRVPGLMIFGKQRFGKTWGIKYLCNELPFDFGATLPVFMLPARAYRLASEGAFFGDLLRAVGHAYTNGKPAAKRDRLLEYLHEQAVHSGLNRLVFFIDEAQKLHEFNYEWLVDVHNELEKKGVTPTWILVGQKELVHQREAFVLAEKDQIVGRFMVHSCEFVGPKSVDDFRRTLDCYDDAELTEYPQGSGWSYTRYFFPACFENGWRLAGEAEPLWKVFHEIRIERKLPGNGEIPMQYFARTVEYALRTFSNLGETDEPLTVAMWRDAIENSGYAEAAVYV